MPTSSRADVGIRPYVDGKVKRIKTPQMGANPFVVFYNAVCVAVKFLLWQK